MLSQRDKIHFIGIGGAGMCPLAEVLYKKGKRVTGSDVVSTAITQRLESLGIAIQYHHTPKLVKDANLIVYSSAVKPDNEELLYAKHQGILCIKRAEVMGDLMKTMLSIGIAGTHGKTTTTSILGTIFHDAKKDPTVIIGGPLKASDSNAIIGTSNILITEADEYDRSFLKMYPTIAIITNIEEDHLDIYDNIENLKEAFTQYLKSIPADGMAVICEDDENVVSVCENVNCKLVTYGITKNSKYRAKKIRIEKSSTLFTVEKNGINIGKITLPLLGLHNVYNALAAITVSLEQRISFTDIQDSLKNFKGVKRRFEIRGSARNITVIDDYAHHPTEVRASLLSAKEAGYNRVIVIFQPHLYSRTKDFLTGFAQSLLLADVTIVTGIYKAREKVTHKVSSLDIVKVMKEMGYNNGYYVEKLDEIINTVMPLVSEGDCVILMGAGDINEIADQLLTRIRNG